MMLRINFSINFLENLIEEIKKRVDYIILRLLTIIPFQYSKFPNKNGISNIFIKYSSNM